MRQTEQRTEQLPDSQTSSSGLKGVAARTTQPVSTGSQKYLREFQ
ncbi:hypothetical protein LEMLEM_LOCUS608 [Lemmus lemmus]